MNKCLDERESYQDIIAHNLGKIMFFIFTATFLTEILTPLVQDTNAWDVFEIFVDTQATAGDNRD
jgi:hypothetical protein